MSLIGLLFLLVQGAITAFTFSPISQEFTAEGKNSSRVFTINNESRSERIAVKVSVFARIMDEEGRETLEPCPGDFLIYPSQSILDPGESRSVRVKWQGGPVNNREKAYRIIAEQLPVELAEDDTPEEGGGIRFTFRYEGSLYVVPENAAPSIELTTVTTVTDVTEETYTTEVSRINEETGETELVEVSEVREIRTSLLRLTFENNGNRHAILGELRLVFNSAYDNFEEIELGPDDLPGVAGENILAGNRRVFLIPEPPAVQGEELLWEFSYKPVY